MSEQERRTLGVPEVRLLEEEGQEPRIVGYAAVFNELSEDLFGFRERIRPGAFAKTVDESDVRALWNHERGQVLGRTKSGTLSLEEDDRGLRYEVDVPDTSWGRDAVESIRRGDVSESSFGFETVRDEWEVVDGQPIRTLVEVRLFDVSPVTFPAYPQTSSEVRERAAEMAPPRSAGGRGESHSAPGQVPHPEGDGAEGAQADDDLDAQVRLDLMRRELELVEAG